MNRTAPLLLSFSAVSLIAALLVCRSDAAAPGPKVSAAGNVHNLSSLNISVKYRAADDGNIRGQQVCIFCHTPHSASSADQGPLWNRSFSGETFQRYTSETLRIRNIAAAQYGAGAQPNGSSKLCLSCHDGVSRLGAVLNGPEIQMVNSNPVIEGLASFKPDTNKMLSGHHPVSFVYLTGFSFQTQTGIPLVGLPETYRFLPASSAGKVKLFDTKRSGNGWMQCTTCHDPHQNQSDESLCYNVLAQVPCDSTNTRKVAPFWVYHGTNTSADQDTGSVCKVCHALGTPTGYSPW